MSRFKHTLFSVAPALVIATTVAVPVGVATAATNPSALTHPVLGTAKTALVPPAVSSVTAAVAPAVSALPSVVPGLVKAAKVVAAVAPATTVDFSILLRGPHDSELATLANEVSDPKSPEFRHFFTRAEMLKEFDPPAAATNTVVNTLKALGVTVIRTSSDGRMVDASAPAGVISRAFGVRFAYVKTATTAVERVALNQPILPALLQPLISDIIGLSATPVQTMADPVSVTTDPAPVYLNARPCSSGYYGQVKATNLPGYDGQTLTYNPCGYTPGQIRAAYRVPQTGLTGKGVRIGIVDDYSSPTMVKDTNEYSVLHGLPPFKPGQYVDHSDPTAQHVPEIDVDTPIEGDLPVESPQGWSGEQSLDVEMEHTMAPDATIEYYGGDQGIGLQPLEAEFLVAIADDQAQFISDSWGIDEGDLLVTPADFKFMDTALDLGALEGIGASFSSGDDGDNIEENDVKSADFPASEDMATAVGGTTLVVGANNDYVGETYWGTRYAPLNKTGTGWNLTPVSGGEGPAQGPGTITGAAGGGVSEHYAEPYWQKPIVPASLTTQYYTSPDGENTNNVTKPGRVVPDISLEADSTTGVLVGQTQTDADGVERYSEFRIGGTSVSSPLFGGLMALAIQENGGNSLGFVSPALYQAYVESPNAFRHALKNLPDDARTDYTDTTNPASRLIYHLRLMGNLGTLHWLPGYDDSTGLGSPCASVFVKAIVTPSSPEGTAAGCGAPMTNVAATPNAPTYEPNSTANVAPGSPQ